MSTLNLVETLSIWILGSLAIVASGFIYQRFWRYIYHRLGLSTQLQTERGDEEKNQVTLAIAWISGEMVACIIIRRIWQLEPLRKDLLIWGGTLAILVCGFLGLSVPEIWAIWHKQHK